MLFKKYAASLIMILKKDIAAEEKQVVMPCMTRAWRRDGRMAFRKSIFQHKIIIMDGKIQARDRDFFSISVLGQNCKTCLELEKNPRVGDSKV